MITDAGNDNSNTLSDADWTRGGVDMRPGNAALRTSANAHPVSSGAGFDWGAAFVPPSPSKLLGGGGSPVSSNVPPANAGSFDESQQYGPSNQVTVHPSATVPRDGASATAPGSAGPVNEMDAYPPDRNAVIGPTTSYSAPGPVTTAVNQGLPGGSGVPTGMTTEQSNAYYGPINAAMTARTEQDRQQNRAVSDAQSNASVAIERQRQLDNDVMRAKNSSGSHGMRAVQLAQQQANGAYRDTVAAQGSLTAARTGRDYTKEAGASQDLIQKAQQAQLDQAGKSQALVSGQQGVEKGAQELQTGKYQLMQQQHLSDLQARATAPGPEGDAARDALAMYQKAQTGKGGPITAEDKLKVYGDFLQSTARMMGGDALSHVPNFTDWSNMLSGKASPPPADWMARAKAANPGANEDDLAKLYASKKPTA